MIWSLIGDNISDGDFAKFNSRKDRDEIKKHAIKILRRNQFLSNLDLKELTIVLGDDSIIEIYPAGKELAIPTKKKNLFKRIAEVFKRKIRKVCDVFFK